MLTKIYQVGNNNDNKEIIYFKKRNYLFILYLVVLGLCCCMPAFSSCCEQGLLYAAEGRFLIAVVSPIKSRVWWVDFFFPFIFVSWRLITLQYCSGFCHTLTWISHGVTCVPHPDPPSHLLLHPIPLVLPSAPALSTCLVHPTWAGDLFHPW